MKVSVRVTPNARRERFEMTGDNQFTATITEPPERNEANTRVQRLVAAHYNVPLTSVRFLTGMRTKKKVFEVVEPQV
ncbi:MAG TPA: DUF167 domain-containing protein [Candidatus Paceibacterota bacterium]|nr:DUF167 domain-containing protein [Candidatus Paceibacterota bacterium]